MKNHFLLAIVASFFASFTLVYPQFSLEDILGAPYTSSLKASQDGSHLAWVVNKKGVRNLWHTAVHSIEPVKLTDYQTDDGLSLNLQAVLPEHVVFVRGNGNNRDGEPANPASLPETPTRQLLRIHVSTQSIDTLAATSGAVLAPDGKGMIYTKGKTVFHIQDISQADPIPRQLFAVRGGVGSLRWSPGGGYIAFVSPRGDHSFVGVFNLKDKKIRWMAPALGFDTHPAWAPDGKRLAFLRRPGQGKDQLPNLTGGNPFQVMVGDLQSGKVTSIWQSPGDDGGFAQYYPNRPLRWTGAHILFYSEHEGWNHIYSIRPDGSGLRDLTPGSCITENSTLSPDGNILYSSSNCGDTNRRHIWQANIATGSSEQITGPTGIQTHATGLADGAVAYREGTFDRPTTAVIQKGGQKILLEALPDTFPGAQLQKPGEVTFKAPDGQLIHGQLFVPPPGTKKIHPAVVYMHGGPIRQMLPAYHYSSYYANAYSMNQYLASRGYVVLSVNYRSGIGYGRAFRRAPKQGPRGATEYQDIVAAGKYLQSLESVDPERVGLWGGSYGGYLTAMGLARNPELFRAGVDLHGVHDWAWRGRDFSPGGGWGITGELMEQAYASSPVSDLSNWKGPVLIISGDDDRNVMIGQSIDLKYKLDALGVHTEVLVFPDEVHGFLRYDSWLRAFQATADFFDRFLKK